MTAALSRRALFRGGSTARPIRRPPWTNDDFTDTCTRCSACIPVCPEGLLYKGDGGFPEISFTSEGCNFCQECVKVCPAPVFDISRTAFNWHIALSEKCLPLSNIDCQSCQDACEPRAIRFRPTLGRVPQPELSLDACNGCGACIAVCPTDAIKLEANNV